MKSFRVFYYFFIQGSEAAAATAVRLTKRKRQTTSDDKSIEFKINHPFLFMIRECYQNITLFSGKVLAIPTS